jgi:hypothetical protein
MKERIETMNGQAIKFAFRDGEHGIAEGCRTGVKREWHRCLTEMQPERLHAGK